MTARHVALVVVLACVTAGCRDAANETECEERDFASYDEVVQRDWDGGTNQSSLERSCEEHCASRDLWGGRLRACSKFDVPGREQRTVGFYCERAEARGRCEKDFF